MEALDFRLSGLGPGRTLPEQLRARRRKRSMSLDQAAMRASLSRTTVGNLENGGGSVASLLAVIAPSARRRSPERSYWGQGGKGGPRWDEVRDGIGRGRPIETVVDHPIFRGRNYRIRQCRVTDFEGGTGTTTIRIWTDRLPFLMPFSPLISELAARAGLRRRRRRG